MTRTLGILHTQVQFTCEFRCNHSKKQVKNIAAKSEVRVHFQSVLSGQAGKSLDCKSTSFNLKKVSSCQSTTDVMMALFIYIAV